MEEASETNCKPVFAIEDVLENLGIDDKLLAVLVSDFLESLPSAVGAVTCGVQEGNLDRVVGQSHKLKGAALNFGAWSLAAAAEKLERLGDGSGLSEGDSLLASLKHDVARFEQEARSWLASVGA